MRTKKELQMLWSEAARLGLDKLDRAGVEKLFAEVLGDLTVEELAHLAGLSEAAAARHLVRAAKFKTEMERRAGTG